MPELLSNKVILTPLMPGNQRGAVWADKQLEHTNWITDVEFRASGPERAGGNMNIWLVHDGPHVVGTSSIYTVKKFDGLVLVVDQHIAVLRHVDPGFLHLLLAQRRHD